MAVQIIIVKRPHQWVVQRDKPGVRTCKTCGRDARQTGSAVCFEEEIERELNE